MFFCFNNFMLQLLRGMNIHRDTKIYFTPQFKFVTLSFQRTRIDTLKNEIAKHKPPSRKHCDCLIFMNRHTMIQIMVIIEDARLISILNYPIDKMVVWYYEIFKVTKFNLIKIF